MPLLDVRQLRLRCNVFRESQIYVHQANYPADILLYQLFNIQSCVANCASKTQYNMQKSLNKWIPATGP